jgi:hypothetical protein
MKHLYLLFFLSFFFQEISVAQVAPFQDFSGYFKTFYKDNVRTLEHQRVNSFQAGDNLVAYIDARGNFKVYDGEHTEQISIQEVSFKNSDFLLAWKIGSGIFSYDKGVKKMLTAFGGDFVVTDSMVIFQDTRFKTLNVLYRGDIIQLMQQTGEMTMPESIGENIIAFKDNGDVYRIFWNGKLFEVGGSSLEIVFNSGTDIVCFNDAINKTFAVFDKGTFIDIESMYMKNYKSGRGFIVYEDLSGNLWKYQSGNKSNLTNFCSGVWEVKDDLVMWNENALMYTIYKDEKVQICNYLPARYFLKNKTVAYKNNIGGVSVFIDGKNTMITNQTDSDFTIYGNSVLVELFNKSFLYFSDGKLIQN